MQASEETSTPDSQLAHSVQEPKNNTGVDNETSEQTADPENSPEGAIRADGSINWDCPCLQGMAHGPCGDGFKAAFSCFVYSEADPKGSDCIDAFKAMQACMLEHPEHYAPREGNQDEAADPDDDLDLQAPIMKPEEQLEKQDHFEKEEKL